MFKKKDIGGFIIFYFLKVVLLDGWRLIIRYLKEYYGIMCLV